MIRLFILFTTNMGGVIGFLIGVFVGMFMIISVMPTENELKVRLYELGYNSGQQTEIMSGLYK